MTLSTTQRTTRTENRKGGSGMKYIGYVKMGTDDPDRFEFEVEDDATDDDITCEAEVAFWGSGNVDLWWEEAE